MDYPSILGVLQVEEFSIFGTPLSLSLKVICFRHCQTASLLLLILLFYWEFYFFTFQNITPS